MTYQKAQKNSLANISNNLIDKNGDTGFLDNNNPTYVNIDIDIDANTNFNKTMTNKNNNNLCKNEFRINFEDLFQQVQD